MMVGKVLLICLFPWKNGNVMSSLIIFKELVSILGLIIRNRCFLKFLSLLCPSYLVNFQLSVATQFYIVF